MIEVQPDLHSTLRRRFAVPAEDARVRRTAAALEANGITVLRARNSAEAKRIVLDLIPAGSHVHQGASQSLEAAGITDEIERSGRYEPLRPRVFSMDPCDAGRRDPPPRRLTRDHARQCARRHRDRVAGRRLREWQPTRPSRLRRREGHSSGWDAEDRARPRGRTAAYRRVRFPLEDARAQAAYGIHSGVNKVLIVNREWTPDRITVVLCDEPLGFQQCLNRHWVSGSSGSARSGAGPPPHTSRPCARYRATRSGHSARTTRIPRAPQANCSGW